MGLKMAQDGGGLSSRPAAGWPLDELLVGPATLRTLRQLLRPRWTLADESLRAWDVALWSGVTPQGASNSMERIESFGLLRRVMPRRAWHATTYRLVDDHPLVTPLEHLFALERAMVRGDPVRGLSASGHPRIPR